MFTAFIWQCKVPARCTASASHSSAEVVSSGTQCLARKLDCACGKSQLFHTTSVSTWAFLLVEMNRNRKCLTDLDSGDEPQFGSHGAHGRRTIAAVLLQPVHDLTHKAAGAEPSQQTCTQRRETLFWAYSALPQVSPHPLIKQPHPTPASPHSASCPFTVSPPTSVFAAPTSPWYVHAQPPVPRPTHLNLTLCHSRACIACPRAHVYHSLAAPVSAPHPAESTTTPTLISPST